MSARRDGAGSFAQMSVQLAEARGGREVHLSEGLFSLKHNGVSENEDSFYKYIMEYIYILLAGKPK